MAQQKEVISTINGLIETLKDGEKGFKEAAEAVKDPQLKSLFQQYSQQRSRFANELQTQARSLGESDPEKTSSAAGATGSTAPTAMPEFRVVSIRPIGGNCQQ